MSRRPRRRRLGPVAALALVVAVLATTGLACGGDGGGSVPAADAAPPPDARGVVDAAPEPDRIDPLLWVQFSATGCASGGSDQAPCEGLAPLTATFTAAAPAAIDTYLWDFGDGTPTDTEPRPTHVFDTPGTYDVSLTVGGPGGTASSLRVGFVIAARAPVGAPCRTDGQCQEGLSCFCGDGQDCPLALAGGFCSRDCARGIGCPDGSTCADLAADASAEPWQGVLCVATCDPTCRGDFACRDLLGGDSGEPWVVGCFPDGVLSPLGGACYDGSSRPVDASCVGGACFAVGARGLCTGECETSADCPESSACATFNGGERRCLRRCPTGSVCATDPWLACAAPGAAGDLGFTVDEDPPDDAGYCAPRPCSEPSECAGGTCRDGHCSAE